MPNQLNSLFSSTVDDAAATAAASAIFGNVDLGNQIQAAFGVSADNVQSSETILVSMGIDDSGSISGANQEQAIRDGHNAVLQAMSETKQKDSILAYCGYLNGKILYPYSFLDQAIRMDANNYRANGGTPLYDYAVQMVLTVIAKAREFELSGVPVRTVSLIVTDGYDEHSRKYSARDVRGHVEWMRATERHIVFGMGIENAPYANQNGKAAGRSKFYDVFEEMGIPTNCILTPGSSLHDIRAGFQMFSQSAIRASQNAGSFSQVALGGFGVRP